MTAYDIWSIVRIAVNAVYVLALIFAMSNFKCGAKTARIAYLVVLAVSAAFNIGAFLLLGRERMMQMFAVSVAVPCLAALLFLTRDRFPELFFNFFTSVNALYLVSVIGLSVSKNELLWLDTLVRAALFTGILYLFSHYFSGPYHFLSENMKKGWWAISAIPFLFFAMVMFLGLFPALNHDNFPAVLLLYVILGFVYVVIYQVFLNTYERIKQGEWSRMLEMQLSIQRQNEERLRCLRHDIRHYMAGIGVYLQEGRIEDALRFIDRFDVSALPSNSVRWCENNVLNVILSYYLDLARRAEIQVEARLELPEELPVDATELTAVFANAIENAVNACRRQPEGEARRLVLNAAASPQLAIEIANTYGGEVKFGRDGLPQPLETGHGVGTVSIRAFARRHGASCTFSIREGMFCLRLLLPPREPAPANETGTGRESTK